MSFNAEKVAQDIIRWISQWFSENGEGCNAVIGISGGKDSSVVAALCVQALGRERVMGVLMPNGVQPDIDVSLDLVNTLGIKYVTVNINNSYNALMAQLEENLDNITDQTRFNLPSRLRMTSLYAVAQSCNGRVANTCNLSEDWVGYSTRYGDSAGDFSPISQLTVAEVKAIGRVLKLPERFVDKVPIDGLCGKTDEENLGFTYETLDRYIRTGICEDNAVKEKIDLMHKRNLFKLELMPSFPYSPEA